MGRKPGLLWRSPDLDLLRQFAARADGDLTESQEEFRRACETQEAEERRTALWQAQKELRQRRLAQLLAVLAVLAALGASQLAVVARRSSREAQRQRAKALLAVSENVVDPLIGALILRELPAQSSGEEDLPVWRRVANKPIPLQVLRGHKARVQHVSFSHDSKLLVSSSLDGTACLWDVDHRDEPIQIFSAPAIPVWEDVGVTRASFSEDDRRLLIQSGDSAALVTVSERSKAIPLVLPDRLLWTERRLQQVNGRLDLQRWLRADAGLRPGRPGLVEPGVGGGRRPTEQGPTVSRGCLGSSDILFVAQRPLGVRVASGKVPASRRGRGRGQRDDLQRR